MNHRLLYARTGFIVNFVGVILTIDRLVRHEDELWYWSIIWSGLCILNLRNVRLFWKELQRLDSEVP